MQWVSNDRGLRQFFYGRIWNERGRYQQSETTQKEAKSLSPTKDIINIINENTDESSQEGRCTIDVRSESGNPSKEIIHI